MMMNFLTAFIPQRYFSLRQPNKISQKPSQGKTLRTRAHLGMLSQNHKGEKYGDR